MRNLVLAAGLVALSAMPSFAQQALPAVLTKVDALTLRNACLSLAGNEAGVADAITAAGWKVEPMPGATAYSKTSFAELKFEAAGRGALLWTTESYPGYTFGFCRLDFPQLEGALGLPGIAADDSFKIESANADTGYDAAFSRTADGVRTLIVGHEDTRTFSLQVTVITETPAP